MKSRQRLFSRMFRRPPSHGETADLSEVRSQHTTERSSHHLLEGDGSPQFEFAKNLDFSCVDPITDTSVGRSIF